MDKTKLTYTSIRNLTHAQKTSVLKLSKECFSDVPQKDKDEDFIAKPFGKIFAYNNNKIVGMLNLFKRNIAFDGKKIVLGGIGGVCVTSKMQRKSFGTLMLIKGLNILKKRECDIACLNVDLDKKVYRIYEKVGFKMMDREISFENIMGEIIKDKGKMFRPINSEEIYNLVMKSKKTFHYGRGYW